MFMQLLTGLRVRQGRRPSWALFVTLSTLLSFLFSPHLSSIAPAAKQYASLHHSTFAPPVKAQSSPVKAAVKPENKASQTWSNLVKAKCFCSLRSLRIELRLVRVEGFALSAQWQGH
jgi:hypothetical protein